MSRIAQARRKIRVARAAIGVGAVAALTVFAGLARASHPATSHARTGATTARQSSAAQNGDGTFFGGDGGDSYSYLGPSGSAAPQVQSGGS